ncbi:Site-specific DNA-cytosine methylase [Devosia crocina]|uniref:Site-specific DNA-cytosine methylase n=1 Tax=Devosia crocina TaxID=429728 RepID=A0A1I7N9I9_9HYPH|nr:DNA cytosine methyltransferase [Devosia crocina]SFV31216.1 Site-specific DNA-cytosine methylase [Devosia crocina]
MNAILPVFGKEVTFTHFQLFCGLGGTAKGFNRGKSRVGGIEGRFRCVGGIDVDPASIRDFTRLAGVEGTVLDLFDREQYVDFHGRQPPADWREATSADIRSAAHGEFPDIVFLSAPCKGFSGLLGETQSKTAKYQALNRLTLRGVWLMLEAFKDDLPKLIGFENVPRIAKRGRHLLDQICALLRSYGYAVSETTHDCGVLGGLGQSRKRFLLVARHEAKVPPFLWEPPKRRLRGVGEILEKLPLPGDPLGGAMHRMPALQWKTWVRLAFVEAGSDWRSLNKLAIENGNLRDFGIMPEGTWRDDIMGVLPWGATSGTVTGKAGATTGRFNIADPRGMAEPHNGSYGVESWDDSAGVVTANGRPASGRFSVADPRFEGLDYKQYGVRRWRAVINVKAPGQGVFSVADPRYGEGPHFSNVFRVVEWDKEAGAISAGQGPTSGGQAVADPRPAQRDDYKQTKYRVTGMDEAAGAVIAASTTGNGAFAVADPRPVGLKPNREAFETGGHYGVVPWDGSSRAVPGFAKNNNGPWSVADPRDVPAEAITELPKPEERLVAVIRALDGTWHRPFTTLELAALQSLVDPDEPLVLDGTSDSAWRERIGNAVPPDAAEAIASVMATTLLLAMTGETFMLSSEPIWVRPFAVALSIDHSPNDGMLD